MRNMPATGLGRPHYHIVSNISSDRVLVEDGSGREALYTTLSHCWGERGPSIKLDKATYKQLTTVGVDFADLPRTYQDTIHVTRQLEKSIKYIWIDSLCIVQDDLADWHTEAHQMLSVYGSSYLNICAKHAADATEGCFIDVDVDGPPHTSYSIPGTDVIIREVPRPTHHDHGVHHVDSQPNPQPLLKRGWVLQECLLAPRLVYFDRHELLWECEASKDCQCGALSTMIGFKQYWSSALAPGEISHMGKEHPICAWMKILPKYTSMRLTHETDRLVALVGVAQKLQQSNVGEYIAGMWWSNLERQMTWYLTDTFTKRSDRRNAPSWSWASRQGSVRFSEAGNWNMDARKWSAQHAQILSIDNLPFSSNDPQSATLKVRSRFVAIQAIAVLEGPPAYYRFEEDGKFVGFGRGDLGVVSLGTRETLILLWWGSPWDGSASWLMLKESASEKEYYERFGLWPCRMIQQQCDAAVKLAGSLSVRTEMTVKIL